MTKEEITKLLSTFTTEEKAGDALRQEIDNLLSSDQWNIIEAVSEYMISQNLRAGDKEPVAYGRAQGIQGLLDFVRVIPEIVKKTEEMNKETEESNIEKVPSQGSYGLT